MATTKSQCCRIAMRKRDTCSIDSPDRPCSKRNTHIDPPTVPSSEGWKRKRAEREGIGRKPVSYTNGARLKVNSELSWTIRSGTKVVKGNAANTVLVRMRSHLACCYNTHQPMMNAFRDGMRKHITCHDNAPSNVIQLSVKYQTRFHLRGGEKPARVLRVFP